MSRPRIRTIKPECWQDEAVGGLTHTERLLWLGLITMADDEGRLRAPITAINGHVFPWDDLPNVKVKRALDAIEKVGLIVQYEHDGKPYVAFPSWAAHQKIDRATSSKLPASNRGTLVEPSTNARRTDAA